MMKPAKNKGGQRAHTNGRRPDARLVRAKRDGKNVIYSLSDDHVHTMLAQGMTHICE